MECEADRRGRRPHQWALILRLRRLMRNRLFCGPSSGTHADDGNDPRQYAPATLRNRDFILGILRDVLPTKGVILEVKRLGRARRPFCQKSPSLVFQPSDREPEALQSVAAWVKATRVTNVRAPMVLDASQSRWPIASADRMICINMVHISPWDATLGLIRGAAAILPPTAPFYLYGPYKREGFATTPSNQAFDRSLRDHNPAWVLQTSKRSPRLRNPSDLRSRQSPRCPQTI